jgi:hypothetical protein
MTLLADEKHTALISYFDGWAELAKRSPLHKPEWAEFATQDEAVYHHGHAFSTDPLTDAERTILLDLFKGMGFVSIIKQCFRNATMLADLAEMKSVPLRYAEGTAWSLIPFQHAWCSLNGKPIDITLREMDEGNLRNPKKLLARVERNLEETAYWGYEVPQRDRRRHLYRNMRYCPVIEDPEGDWPLLRSRTLPWEASA